MHLRDPSRLLPLLLSSFFSYDSDDPRHHRTLRPLQLARGLASTVILTIFTCHCIPYYIAIVFYIIRTLSLYPGPG